MWVSKTETFGDDLTCVAVRIEDRERPAFRAEIEISSDLKELGRARAFVREACRLLGPHIRAVLGASRVVDDQHAVILFLLILIVLFLSDLHRQKEKELRAR